MEKIKWVVSIVVGFMAAMAKQYYVIVLFVACAVVFDWVTGLLKAKATGEGVNSKKATVGFWKKLALLMALFFGFFLDYFIPYMIGTLGILLPETALFGMVIGCYIVINECISIAENLYVINPAVLPNWIVKLLTAAKEQIEKKGERNEKEIN